MQHLDEDEAMKAAGETHESSELGPGDGPADGPGDDDAVLHAVRHTIRMTVGSARVDLVIHDTDAPGLTFVNVHDDEQTSVEAALHVIGLHGGRVFELQHGDVRNVTFVLEGTEYVFDPNRMFTDAGAKQTLEDLGPYSDAAHRVVRTFAEEVFAAYGLNGRGPMVTIHNTMTGRFSAASYLEDADHGEDAADVVIHDGTDPLDFFLTTEADIHEALSAAGFNSVLQDNIRARDDGSLSIRAVREGIDYVLVEAFLGRLERQIHMLLALRTVLQDLGRP